MLQVVRGLLLVVAATVIVSGPTGCSSKEGAPNPELKVPDVPPSTRSQGGGALTSDLKDPNQKGTEPEKK